MRIRPLAALSLAALTALALAGCGSAAPDGSPSASSTPSADCLLNATPGASSDAIEVSGSGADLEVTVPEGLEFANIERTVIEEGDGAEVLPGDFVSGYYRILDGTTGDLLQSSVDTSPDDSSLVPMLLDAQSMSIFVAALECQPLGTTTALAIPGSAFGEGASPVVLVAQSVEELPTVATGEDQPAPEGAPTVELADDGQPTVTIPDAAAPTELQMWNLKLGDGPTVEPGDTAYVQYMGVKWSDGTEFDSSWSRGAPTSFATTAVVDGFGQALEGHTVGSQVLVVIPPALGYGEGEINETDLVGETLVFVVDILGVERAPQQQ